MPNPHGTDLLTEVEAAAVLRLHPTTLKQWRSDERRTGESRGPRHRKIGSAVRYRLTDLNEYVDLCAVNPAVGAEIEAAHQVSAVIA